MAEYSTEIGTMPQVSYLTTDHLGSPRVITDQDGNITSRKDYTAFGEENISAARVSGLGYSGSGEETRKGYTGYEKDSESGLDFAQARYYNSTHGRFTSIDPLTVSMDTKNPQTLNRYSYVLNSPYKYTDPLGLLPISANSSGCSAEFSSCDDNGRGIGIDDYSYRIHQTMVARQEAQRAFSRGDTETGWRIIRESEGALMALDQNGNVLEDPNSPTVTVDATVNHTYISTTSQDGPTMSDATDKARKAFGYGSILIDERGTEFTIEEPIGGMEMGLDKVVLEAIFHIWQIAKNAEDYRRNNAGKEGYRKLDAYIETVAGKIANVFSKKEGKSKPTSTYPDGRSFGHKREPLKAAIMDILLTAKDAGTMDRRREMPPASRKNEKILALR